MRPVTLGDPEDLPERPSWRRTCKISTIETLRREVDNKHAIVGAGLHYAVGQVMVEPQGCPQRRFPKIPWRANGLCVGFWAHSAVQV